MKPVWKLVQCSLWRRYHNGTCLENLLCRVLSIWQWCRLVLIGQYYHAISFMVLQVGIFQDICIMKILYAFPVSPNRAIVCVQPMVTFLFDCSENIM